LESCIIQLSSNAWLVFLAQKTWLAEIFLGHDPQKVHAHFAGFLHVHGHQGHEQGHSGQLLGQKGAQGLHSPLQNILELPGITQDLMVKLPAANPSNTTKPMAMINYRTRNTFLVAMMYLDRRVTVIIMSPSQ
jgi:hypothetical protein